jgi:hypothetical protein
MSIGVFTSSNGYFQDRKLYSGRPLYFHRFHSFQSFLCKMLYVGGDIYIVL